MRVALFFDGKNFYSNWREKAENRKINFDNLVKWLVRQVNPSTGVFIAAHYYTGVENKDNELAESSGNLKRFLSDLKTKRGFFVHTYERKSVEFSCKHCHEPNRFTKEKKVDTYMVADMIYLAATNGYDAAILLSGDSDHIPALEYTAKLGKQAWVATWGGSGLSEEMRPYAYDHIDLMRGIEQFSLPLDQSHETVYLPTTESDISEEEYEELLDEFVSALRRAEDHFGRRRPGSTKSGYVGLGYFLTKWRSNLPDNDALKKELLATLLEEGRVVVYDSPDGHYQAIKLNPDADPFDIPHNDNDEYEDSKAR